MWGPNMLINGSVSGTDDGGNTIPPSLDHWTTAGTVAYDPHGADDDYCFKLSPHSSMVQVITNLTNVPDSFQFMFSTYMLDTQSPKYSQRKGG